MEMGYQAFLLLESGGLRLTRPPLDELVLVRLVSRVTARWMGDVRSLGATGAVSLNNLSELLNSVD